MKRLFLTILFALSCTSLFAQTEGSLIADFRRLIGEPDSVTGTVTRPIARTWLNMGLREFANYGIFSKETTFVGRANVDTFRLPIDFILPKSVRKTLAGKAYRMELNDSTVGFIQRLDTIVLSTVRPDTLFDTTKSDIVAIDYCYKKNATDKAIRPLIQVMPDSLQKVGRALVTRQLPAEFLSERLDTIVPSTTQPINLMRSDVFELRAAYRKDLTSGQIKALIRVPVDSLSKIATTQSDYYYYSGQPSPRIVFGQKKSFADTVYCEVLVASDFFTFIGQPYPRLIMGKIPTTADTCFCETRVILPKYSFVDTGVVSTTGRGFLKLFPPLTRVDSVRLEYFAEIDTSASDSTTSTSIQGLTLPVREALKDYMASRFYFKKGMQNEFQAADAHWREVLNRWAIMRGFPVVQSNK